MRFKEKVLSKKIKEIVSESKQELIPFISGLDWNKLSKHNKGYLTYKNYPAGHLDLELKRYIKTIDYVNANFDKSSNILDIGFFLPIVPIALSKLGYKVSAVEKLAYYDGTLDNIIDFAQNKYGINVLDFDILDVIIPESEKIYDVILLLAVLEHLNGSPKSLLNNAKALLKPGGFLAVEVPNVATIAKRLGLLLKGKPPYPAFKDYYDSEYPFSGHNREYTVQDLKYALERIGLDIVDMEVYNYSIPNFLNWKSLPLVILEILGPDSFKESIWTLARKDSKN